MQGMLVHEGESLHMLICKEHLYMQEVLEYRGALMQRGLYM